MKVQLHLHIVYAISHISKPKSNICSRSLNKPIGDLFSWCSFLYLQLLYRNSVCHIYLFINLLFFYSTQVFCWFWHYMINSHSSLFSLLDSRSSTFPPYCSVRKVMIISFTVCLPSGVCSSSSDCCNKSWYTLGPVHISWN